MVQTELTTGRTSSLASGENVVAVTTVVSQNAKEAAATPAEMTRQNNMTQGERKLLTAHILLENCTYYVDGPFVGEG